MREFEPTVADSRLAHAGQPLLHGRKYALNIWSSSYAFGHESAESAAARSEHLHEYDELPPDAFKDV
jgi:hypothetical protein